jgi:uncharacterized protein (TIGR00730 family)
VSSGFTRIARELGESLADRGVPIVYGAGGRGVMGALADGALGAGGEVIGVIPQDLMDREYGRRDLAELHVTRTMHERKQLMHDLSSGFVTLPGGLGTFDELFEMLTWRQLGFHRKPFAILDVEGYFRPLRVLFEHAVEHGFVRDAERELIRMVPELGDLLATIDRWVSSRPA